MEWNVNADFLKTCALAAALAGIAALSACGGGGGGAPVAGGSGARLSGQAILGPLAGARVDILDLASGRVLASGQTLNDADLTTAGSFSLTGSIPDDNRLYLVRVSGGLDIDADDDGRLDVTPTVNNGVLHGVVSGQRLAREPFNVSMLTELVYRRFAHLLEPVAARDRVLAEFDRRARHVLQSDVDGDGDIDSDDLLEWHPVADGARLRSPATAYSQVISSIHRGEALSSATLLSADAMLGPSASRRSPSAVVSGGIAYMADGAIGLSIVDITRPEAPQRLATLGASDKAWSVAVDGNLAYLADGASGMAVVGISDPANPVELSRFATRGEARGVVLSAGVLYLVDSVDGLLVLDTNNPAQIQVSQVIPVTGDLLGLAVEQQFTGRVLVPVRFSDGSEADLVYKTQTSAGVVWEGYLGPDPNNPALESIVVGIPPGSDTDGGVVLPTNPIPPSTSSGANASGLILEGTIGANGASVLDTTVITMPPAGGRSTGIQFGGIEISN